MGTPSEQYVKITIKLCKCDPINIILLKQNKKLTSKFGSFVDQLPPLNYKKIFFLERYQIIKKKCVCSSIFLFYKISRNDK